MNRRTGFGSVFRAFSSPKHSNEWRLMEKRRILVVDNNDGLRAALAQVLGSLGHDVVATGDRHEALGRNDLEQFDVIISDLTEDGDSGQTISEIQRKRLLTPINSIGERPSEIIKAFKIGALNFLG